MLTACRGGDITSALSWHPTRSENGGWAETPMLGFTMFGPEAGEVMAVVQTAMLVGMPYTGLRDAMLAHPTMAEGLGPLFAAVPPAD